MSMNPKDSTEVMEFMTLFARLKQWCDDAPDELADFAKTDSSVHGLNIGLSAYWTSSDLCAGHGRYSYVSEGGFGVAHSEPQEIRSPTFG